jgi:hypothetical protein
MATTLSTRGARAGRRLGRARGLRWGGGLGAQVALALGIAALLGGGYLLVRRERSIAALRRGHEQQLADRLENERELERIRLGYPPRVDR